MHREECENGAYGFGNGRSNEALRKESGVTEEIKREISAQDRTEEEQRYMWVHAKQEEEDSADADIRNEQFYERMAETWSKDAALSELLEENRTRLRNIREERSRMLEESDSKMRHILRQKQEEREILMKKLREEQGE